MIERLNTIQQVRFMEVGILNTVIGYGSYILLMLVGVNYLIANTMSTIIGVVNSYFWNKHYTFQSGSKSKREPAKFVLVYLTSYLLGTLFIFVLVEKFSVNKYLVGLLNLFVTTLISFFGHKYFSFKKEESK